MSSTDVKHRTNYGERQGADEKGMQYYAHLAIYDFCRSLAVGKCVLDVGCGTGYGVRYLKDNGVGEVIALERDADIVRDLQAAYPDINFLQCDLDEGVLPVDSQSIDFIFCSNVMEHVAYVDPVLREFARVIRPDGQVLIVVPAIFNTKNYTKMPRTCFI